MKKNLVSVLVVALCGFSFNAYADVIIDECELAAAGDGCVTEAGLAGKCEMVGEELTCVPTNNGTNNGTNNETNNETNNTTNNETNNGTNSSSNNDTTGETNNTPVKDTDDDGGCSVSGTSGNTGLLFFGLMLLGMVRIARRRA